MARRRQKTPSETGTVNRTTEAGRVVDDSGRGLTRAGLRRGVVERTRVLSFSLRESKSVD